MCVTKIYIFFAVLNFFKFLLTSVGTKCNKGRGVTIKLKQKQETGICHVDEFQQA